MRQPSSELSLSNERLYARSAREINGARNAFAYIPVGLKKYKRER